MCVVAIPESSDGTYLGPETPRHPYFWSHAGNLRAFEVANGEKASNYGVLPVIKMTKFGGAGSRTRVRKRSTSDVYMCIPCINLPLRVPTDRPL